MVSRLGNFKFLHYNNGLRLGVGGAGGRRAGGPTKLYTPLRVVKNSICVLNENINLRDYIKNI